MFGTSYRLEVQAKGTTSHVVYTQPAMPFNDHGESKIELRAAPSDLSTFYTKLGARLAAKADHSLIAKQLGHSDFTIKIASIPTPKFEDYGPSCC